MYNKVLIDGFIIGVLGFGMIACSPFKEVAQANKVAIVHEYGADGSIHMLNAKTGEEIVSCEERKEKGLKECLTEVKIGEDGKPMLVSKSTNEKKETIKVIEGTSFLWHGSSCDTTWVNGRQYETCINW